MNNVIIAGGEQLLGKKASFEDVLAIVVKLDRDKLVRQAVRALNSLAVDRKLEDEQAEVVAYLPPEARGRYAELLSREDPRLRVFHPFQQLVLIHAAARYSKPMPDAALTGREAMEAWALASLQLNDLLFRKLPIPEGRIERADAALHLFCEQGSSWELVNPSQPMRSLARLRDTFTNVPRLRAEYAAAADRLRARFPAYLKLDFETAYNLTAFLILSWHGNAPKIPEDPDAVLINRRTWLENSSIPVTDLDLFLDAVGIRIDEIPKRFDELGAGMSLLELLPFRRRPLLRLDADGVAFLCPQFASEKGGVDLLWLLTEGPEGPKEKRLWTEDYGLLCEGYVHGVLDGLGSLLGGRYIPRVEYPSGEMEGMIHAGRTLAVLEVKGSLISQPILTRGTIDELRNELHKKFVIGDTKGRKGVAQIVDAIHWLAGERRQRTSVRGVDLSKIDTILPVLVVADRALRFPGLGIWFDAEMDKMLRRASLPWDVGPMAICGLEDLENLEQLAIERGTPLMDVLMNHRRRSHHGDQQLWQTYPFLKGMPRRLDRIMQEWMSDLKDRGIMRK